ncbi:unnamed protein product [Moneuplotes crassus]|uniref:FYVE-type domain-containing protein n=1 Tax=Euplotes crassus TaxID=5936 RepID=A0AAD1X9E0_EUPCR|nr:unnamed protein product [Moneuplotes crassus]
MMEMENKLLKEKLEQQMEINKDIRNLLQVQTQRIDSLIPHMKEKPVDIQNDGYEYKYEPKSKHLNEDMRSKIGGVKLFKKRSRNMSSSFEERTCINKDSLQNYTHKDFKRHGDRILLTTQHVETLKSEYTPRINNFEKLAKFNNASSKARQDLSILELVPDLQGSQIDRISETVLTDNERDFTEVIYTQETTNTPSRIQKDVDTLQIPGNAKKGKSLLVPSASNKDYDIFFVPKSSPTNKLEVKEELKKYGGSFNENILDCSRNSQNIRSNRSYSNLPEDHKPQKDKDVLFSVWMDDSKASSCMLCGSDFWLLSRKHHCRVCGKIFCGSCSKYLIIINGKKCRACKFCKENYEHEHQ